MRQQLVVAPWRSLFNSKVERPLCGSSIRCWRLPLWVEMQPELLSGAGSERFG